MMSWTTTGGFISLLVVVLSCSTCGASPVNSTTSYQCFTDVDCQASYNSGYSYIRNIRYCCRSGDSIAFVFKSSRYGFASSVFGFTGDSRDSSRGSNYDSYSRDSDDSSNGRSESEQNDSVSDESDDSRRDDDNGEVRCTCKPVDREKIRNYFNNFWKDMSQKLRRLSRFWTW